jgi:hypothetical protein
MAVPALQWAVGLVVLVESLRLALDSQAGRHFAKAGMPLWMRPALAWTEIAAALLFLLPLTTVLGGYLLLVIFFFAALLHILHGEFEVGGLVVYATAVLVSIAHREPRVPEVVHERS